MTSHYLTTLIKISLIIGTVVLLGLLMLGKEAVGQTFATGSGTGGLELKIDSTTYYNGVIQPQLSWSLKNLKPWHDKFFSFDDVKPGDFGSSSISIHIKKNPAYVCLDFQNLKDKENGRNEPEREVDGNGKGELSSEIEFFAWRDDGDNLFEVGEEALFGTSTQSAKQVLKGKTYPLADSKNGSPYLSNKTKYIGINWCAGDLAVDLSTAKITCDGETMGNEAQTDSMTFDVSLRAVVAKQQPWFTCVQGEKPHGDHHDDDEDEDDDHESEHDDDEDHGGGSGHGDQDDNHNDDDDHSSWHWAKKTRWESVKNYCVGAWNNVRNRHS
ncbi:hypothetical protein H6784_04820 [Candidatus Nomurabacteria bacterium]|nr:hypothetical protein [Candidatus Kaiserbacteria bacterium]MCB9814712.1 hypothetical protein [Candidatus Nomurabacteria bacterium]